MQESWPRVLADACRRLALPEGLAVNEAQTERRLKRLKKQAPDAVLARFPGWESGDPEATRRPPPADARQVDREEAIAPTPVPDLSEADLRAGVEAAASLSARIDVEATHADWQQYVAAMDVPLYSPVGHWITFCRRRARDS